MKPNRSHRAPAYPPHGDWDPRMVTEDPCPDLLPVRTLHRNPWFAVRERGGYFTTETEEAQGAVLVVVDQQAVVLVRVRRPVLGDATLELPAGGFDLRRETPEAGMRRELAEETGIQVDDLGRFQPLPPIAVSPNRDPRLIFTLRLDIDQHEYDRRGTHDDEIVEVCCVPFARVADMILCGEIYVALPVAMLSRLLLENRSPPNRMEPTAAP